MASQPSRARASEPVTLVDLLQALPVLGRGKALRLVSSRFVETVVEWPRLLELVGSAAGRLLREGIRRNHRVAISLQTDLDSITSFLALIWLGAVPVSVGVPLPGQSHERWLARLAALSERVAWDRLLLDDRSSRLAERREPLGGLRPLALRPVDPTAPAEEELPPPAAVSPADVAFLQFSSGSTSEPTGVVLRHRNVLANLAQICEHDARTADCRVVMWVPLSHDMGLVGGLLSPMLLGNEVTLMHPACFFLRPQSWLEQMSRRRAQVSACPNFALDAAVQRVRERHLEGLDLSSMRFVWNGGEPIRPASVQRFEARLAATGWKPGTVQPAYGLAEATLAVAARAPGAPLRRLGGQGSVSVGRPLAGSRLRVTDDQGRELPPGVVGEIEVSGPSVSEDASGPDGWLRTGDLGMVEPDGELAVTGRRKDLILVRGRNFYGHDVAARLDDLDSLEPGQHHAFSFEAEEGPLVVVFSVPKRSRQAAESSEALESRQDEVKRFLLRELGLPVDEVLLVPRLPRTSSGKVRRSECERLFRESRYSRSDDA